VKRLLLLALLCSVAAAGCSGVILNAEYSQLLDETTALSVETAARAQRGDLDPNEMVEALTAQAQVWKRFRDARDGVKPAPHPSGGRSPGALPCPDSSMGAGEVGK